MLMRRFLIILSVTLLGFTYLTIDGSLEQLGIRRETAIGYITNSLQGGGLAFPESCKKIPDYAKAMIAADMVRLAREYTTSDEFRKWYAEYRKAKMPRPPGPPSATTNAQLSDAAAIQQQISDAEAKMQQLPQDQRAEHQKYIEGLKVRMQQVLQTPPPAAPLSPPADPASQIYSAQLKSYQDSTALWQRLWPENPNQFLRMRLQQYLDLSSMVDFSATTTTDEKGIKHFTNPEYEKKPGSWKRCYRSGKDANDQARSIVQEWISTLR
jgi:hypothetical protein